MKKIEQVIVLGLLFLSALVKISSLIALFKLYGHIEEVPHDLTHKTEIKKIKGQTHEPMR